MLRDLLPAWFEALIFVLALGLICWSLCRDVSRELTVQQVLQGQRAADFLLDYFAIHPADLPGVLQKRKSRDNLRVLNQALEGERAAAPLEALPPHCTALRLLQVYFDVEPVTLDSHGGVILEGDYSLYPCEWLPQEAADNFDQLIAAVYHLTNDTP